VDAATPRTVFQRLGDESDERWIFTPNQASDRIAVTAFAATSRSWLGSARGGFCGACTRETPWDRLHLTYFSRLCGLELSVSTLPLLPRTGFTTRELEAHVEESRNLARSRGDPTLTTCLHAYQGAKTVFRRRLRTAETARLLPPTWSAASQPHYCYDPVTIERTRSFRLCGARCEAHAGRPPPVRANVFHSRLHHLVVRK
jgi:hypothetical protein